jgi:cell fate (sporulation/competence/biofilm development) regulator YlbF (YheA/YmcA/DUF963 family)
MMHDGMLEKAKEVGRLLGQTDEYKALQKARSRLNDDRDAVSALNRLSELEREITTALQTGEQPSEETQREYETMASELQSGPVYQGLVAAQSNFDKLLQKVNERMGEGIEAGSKSSIIMPS